MEAGREAVKDTVGNVYRGLHHVAYLCIAAFCKTGNVEGGKS